MIKVGDKVRFLSTGGYTGFEDFKDCYGIVVDVPCGDETIHASVLNSDGSTHKSFQLNPEEFNFRSSEYEKIGEEK